MLFTPGGGACPGCHCGCVISTLSNPLLPYHAEGTGTLCDKFFTLSAAPDCWRAGLKLPSISLDGINYALVSGSSVLSPPRVTLVNFVFHPWTIDLTISGTGTLLSGVFTPSPAPTGWIAARLVNRTLTLDGVGYTINANTATTATITNPPADPDPPEPVEYSWSLSVLVAGTGRNCTTIITSVQSLGTFNYAGNALAWRGSNYTVSSNTSTAFTLSSSAAAPYNYVIDRPGEWDVDNAVGDWRPAPNDALIQTASPNAKILSTVKFGGEFTDWVDHVISCDITSTTYADQHVKIFFSDTDSMDIWWHVVSGSARTTFTVGGHTQSVADTITSFKLRVYSTGVELFTPYGNGQLAFNVTNTSTQAGVGTGSISGTVTVSSFSLSKGCCCGTTRTIAADGTVGWLTHEVSGGVITRVDHEGPCKTVWVDSVSDGTKTETGQGTEADPWINLNTVFRNDGTGSLCDDVFTPAEAPVGWITDELVGKTLTLDGVGYTISANSTTTLTITSPPAYAFYTWHLGPIGGNCIYTICTTPTCPKVKVLVKGTIDYAVNGLSKNYLRNLVIEPWDAGKITISITSTGTIYVVHNCIGVVWKHTNVTGSTNYYGYGYYYCSSSTFDTCIGTGTATSSDNCYGYGYCNCSSSTFDTCTGTGTATGGANCYGYGYYYCSSSTFDACTGTSSGNCYSYGYCNCSSSTFDTCIGTGTATGGTNYYGYGYYNCSFSTFNACTGTGTATGSDNCYGYGYCNCSSSTFDTCTGTGSGNNHGYGYCNCSSSTFDACTGTGTATGSASCYGYGYGNCNSSMWNNKSHGEGNATSAIGCAFACGFYNNTNGQFGDSTTSAKICTAPCGVPCPYNCSF